jgi:peptidoglycan pentaglycine glycine transferase (the second and third glycine)
MEMIIKKIDEATYEEFVSKSPQKSFYQSVEWMRVKHDKKCELVGLYENDVLVGVSLIMYLQILRKYYIAYASRGFIYDYKNIPEFKKALLDYFTDKNVVMVKIDPAVILAVYNKDLEKSVNSNSLKIISELKKNGFIHFGFNMASEAFQFRFVHRLTLKDSYDQQKMEMSKSTRKNMELAEFRGVKSRYATLDELDLVLKCFQYTIDRKEIKGFPKSFYESLLKEFKDKIKMYIIYIDRDVYLKNLKEKINSLEQEQLSVDSEMLRVNVGSKLNLKKSQINAQQEKYHNELKEIRDIADNVVIASMLTITKYDEVVSLTSGMNNLYRKFNPKYVMYPEMIKDAFKDNLKYVNFLGVKNIMNPNDKDHGVYEVKRGFGGETIEYIGEFDLPVNKGLYKLYKFLCKIKRN